MNSPRSDRPLDSEPGQVSGAASSKPATDLHTGVLEPPRHLVGILRQLGPGLIIAGSIVGSGELIATTKTGAQAGITLLWLIIIGCIIKVFAQVELGRYAISSGKTTLAALNELPGPRARVSWIIWFWMLMTMTGVAQLGGIVGGVGQSLALTVPITGDYQSAIRIPSERELKRYIEWEAAIASNDARYRDLHERDRARIERGQLRLREQLDGLPNVDRDVVERVRRGESIVEPKTVDDRLWAAIVTVITIGLLCWGRYALIQNVSTVLVVTFTFLTIGNVIALQSTVEWHIPISEFLRGLSLQLPSPTGSAKPLATALATFGIIGVGASELISYPYWCLEKGYARHAGPDDQTPAWPVRARGWLKVMQFDAFASMLIYTTATLAFFLMGVAVLHHEGRDPEGMRMVSTLSAAYVPVFGESARWMFLSGAVAVLYSTFLIATAGNARMVADVVRVFGLIPKDKPQLGGRLVTFFSVLMPLTSLGIYWTGADPVLLILIAGAMQALLLPMIGFAALYFRHRRTDRRLTPGSVWDVLLVLSFFGLLIAGGWGIYEQLSRFFK